ncbi:hypothetical protein, partial [Bacteroides pyogenes]|uniref:hypothetical protein n=1 Tax=Bacteroides pyogenes TaxID=310300 RepID=UPI001F3653B9
MFYSAVREIMPDKNCIIKNRRGCVKTKLNQRRTFNLKLEHPKKQEKEPYHYSKQSSIRLF